MVLRTPSQSLPSKCLHTHTHTHTHTLTLPHSLYPTHSPLNRPGPGPPQVQQDIKDHEAPQTPRRPSIGQLSSTEEGPNRVGIFKEEEHNPLETKSLSSLSRCKSQEVSPLPPVPRPPSSIPRALWSTPPSFGSPPGWSPHLHRPRGLLPFVNCAISRTQ